MIAGNWYKYNRWFPKEEYAIWKDAEIFLNDENTRPGWITSRAKFTEFFVNRNKKKLLIAIGESWTYGESLPGVAGATGMSNIFSQLRNCYAPRLALCLDADLHQYAVPGNCNLYMFNELERLLETAKQRGYEDIVVCMLMTEPGREKNGGVDYTNHPLKNIYDVDVNLDFADWLKNYDEIFFEQFESTLKKYDAQGLLFKNFCKINTAKRYDFKIIEKSWIQQASLMCGKKIQAPSFWTAAWIEKLIQEYQGKIHIDQEQVDKELDIIEESLKFIERNPYNIHHPTALGHMMWAHYLADKFYE